MQVSLNWLRNLVDCAMPAEELAETLTLDGFEVEDIEDLGRNADGVVVGRVLEREQHPNADKLSVCKGCTARGDQAPNVVRVRVGHDHRVDVIR